MHLPEPKEIVFSFQKAWSELSDAKEPLSPEAQRKMAQDTGEVLNYLSATTAESSMLNHMYSQSAHDARVKQQLSAERNQLELHREFIESSFEKVDQYLRTIQLAGYAAFFGLWSLSKSHITDNQAHLALILMLVSASVFMFWEILKSSVLALTIRDHSKIGLNSVEEFIITRGKLKGKSSAVYLVSKYRIYPWFISVSSAALSLGFLIFALLSKVAGNA